MLKRYKMSWCILPVLLIIAGSKNTKSKKPAYYGFVCHSLLMQFSYFMCTFVLHLEWPVVSSKGNASVFSNPLLASGFTFETISHGQHKCAQKSVVQGTCYVTLRVFVEATNRITSIIKPLYVHLFWILEYCQSFKQPTEGLYKGKWHETPRQ